MKVKVKPGAKVCGISGWKVNDEGRIVIEVKVKEIACDNQANEGVIELFEKEFFGGVEIVKGMKSKDKIIKCEKLEFEDAIRVLKEC
jgi:uncharacterized protein (TIGR00251 family)